LDVVASILVLNHDSVFEMKPYQPVAKGPVKAGSFKPALEERSDTDNFAQQAIIVTA
jgi:hypothetical protein